MNAVMPEESTVAVTDPLVVVVAATCGGRRHELVDQLDALGCRVLQAFDPSEVGGLVAGLSRGLVLVDLDNAEAASLCRECRDAGNQLEVAFVATGPKAEAVVDAIRDGALDVLSLPIQRDRLAQLIRAAESATGALCGDEPRLGVAGPAALPIPASFAALRASSPGEGEAAGFDSDDAGTLTPIQHMERSAIISALEASAGNAVQAARSLGIGSATVYRKIKRYEIDLKRLRNQLTA